MANSILSGVRTATLVSALIGTLVLAGCAHVPNQWREDGPAATTSWETPTSQEILAKYEPAHQRTRAWDASTISPEPGCVTHWPLYFENPFVDKGHGREGLNKYHIGWEDYVAMPYCYSRFTLNWLMLPVSAIVTPPCRLMESDGVISKQALGYDHDATRARAASSEPEDTPSPASEPTETDGTSTEEHA